MVRTCHRCAHPNPPGGGICAACGAPLDVTNGRPQEGERRIPTILFSDLVGFTRMTHELDPEVVDEVIAEIKLRAQLIVERHGGQVTQFVGDEVMSIFGYPHAHDDDPIRCAHAARALHAMVQTLSATWSEPMTGMPIRLHSGFATGQVVARRSDAENIGGRYPVTGSAVNIAARLRSLAASDEILCCETSHSLIERYFNCTQMPQVILAGVPGRTTVYAIGEPTGVRHRFEVSTERGLTRCQGREREIEALTEALAGCRQGRGRCVFVSGEPGVGKTRLAHELLQNDDVSSTRALVGHCAQIGQATPYQPIVEALRKELGLDDKLDADELHHHAVQALLACEKIMEEHLAYLLLLLAIPSNVYSIPRELSEDALHISLREAITQTLRSLSRKGPVVLILDDWHWADEASREFVATLMPAIHGMPLLLLILSRPFPQPDWIAHSNVLHLHLETLSPDECRAVLQFVTGARHLPTGLAEAIFERTAGNALFTEELGRALVESETLKVFGLRAELTRPLAELRLPLTVQAVVQARLDRLPTTAHKTIKICSVIGRAFDADLPSRLASSQDDVDAAIDELVERDLIRRISKEPPHEYRFKHAITQEVTYETLLHSQRVELHAAAAFALESRYGNRIVEHYEELAHHYQRARIIDKAARYLGLAARRSSQLYRIPQAMQQYQAAIDILDGAELTDDLKRMRIDYSLALGRRVFINPSPGVYPDLTKCRDMALALGDRRRLAALALTLGSVAWLESRHEQARTHLREAMELARSNGDTATFAVALGGHGHTLFYSAEFPRGIGELEDAVSLVRGSGNHAVVHNIYNYLALQYAFTGDFDRSQSLQSEILADARTQGQSFIEQVTRLWSSLGLMLRGDWLEAAESSESAIAIGYTTDAKYLEAYSRCTWAHARFMLGKDTTEAIAAYARSLEQLHALNHKLAISMYEAWFGEMCALTGDFTLARHHAERALECRARQEHIGEVVALRALGIMASTRGTPDRDEVDGLFSSAIRLARERRQRPDEAITHLRHAQALVRLGCDARAHAELDTAEQMFRDLRMPWWYDKLSALRRDWLAGAAPDLQSHAV